MIDDTATVEQTETNAQPPAEATETPAVTGEQELDALLAKQSGDIEQPPAEPEAKSDDVIAAVKSISDRLDLQEKKEMQTAVTTAVETSVTNILAADERINFGEDIVDAMLRREAETNPAFLKAFNNKQADPVTWDGIEKAFARKLGDAAEKRPDPGLTDSLQAARAAVGGTSTHPPQQEEVGGKAMRAMSDAEFKAFTKAQASAG